MRVLLFFLYICILINMRMKTKESLLFEAYKLYASKPYGHVTFAELEKATGLSRGAILYHYKSKELLFNAVIENFVFKESSVNTLISEDCNNFLGFIKKFISQCKDEMQRYRSMGMYNINLAKLHIEFHALSYYKDAQEIFRKWMENERNIWWNQLSTAIENKEIRDDLNLDILSMMFVNIYQGVSFSGISRPKGYDIALLEKELMTLYSLIKIE